VSAQPTERPPTYAAERARELDFEHKKRERGALPLVLSMRYLTTAATRLAVGTKRVETHPVPRPPAGTMSVTFVGHATAMLTTAGARILTDPLLENSFYGLRRAKAAGIADDDLDDVDIVLITHAHRDHLSRTSLRRIARKALLVVPPHCTELVRGLGFEVVELDPGQSCARGDVAVTAVPVRHSGARGAVDYARRGACGYVVRRQAATPESGLGHTSASLVTAYVAGDTGYFSGFAEIGRRFRPDVALLPISGYEPTSFREEHLSPLDAVYAFDDLGARLLVPTSYGSFPLSYERLSAPLEWLQELARERGLVGADAKRRIAVLDHGGTVHVRVVA
jgi:L-ascorbate metabolism protein UlaG (beta-lactamase superfamily)